MAGSGRSWLFDPTPGFFSACRLLKLYKDDRDYRKLFRMVEEMWKAIEAGAFYPSLKPRLFFPKPEGHHRATSDFSMANELCWVFSATIEEGFEMKFRKLRKALVIGFFVCLVLCACALGFLRWDIQSGLDEWCAKAQGAHPHPGDDVAALIAYVQSSSHSLRDRNRAVWALGQARDERAFPVLQAFVTGEKCDHRRQLCQHELKKALDLSGKNPINLLIIRTPLASNR